MIPHGGLTRAPLYRPHQIVVKSLPFARPPAVPVSATPSYVQTVNVLRVGPAGFV